MPWRRIGNIGADPDVLHGLRLYNGLDFFFCVCTQVVINARTSMCRATYCIICTFVIGAVMLKVRSAGNARMAWLKLIVILIR